jgi:putative transposase
MLDAARNIANAGEGLRRLDLMRESKAYQAARKMSRGGAKVSRQEGQGNRVQAPVRSVRLHQPWPPEVRSGVPDNCWIKDHLPGHVAQTAGTSGMVVSMQSKRPMLGQVRTRSCER